MTSTRKEEKKSPPKDSTSHLPARSRQTTTLLDAPRQTVIAVIERGAGAYYSTCRRIANLLNGKR